MRDVVITTATMRVAGQSADLELSVACGSKGAMAYQFRTFDKSGDPIDLRYPNSFGPPQRKILIRLDDAEPRPAYDLTSPYTNQVLLLRAHDYANARKLIAQLPLVNGSETYTIEQTSDGFRAMAAPCLESERVRKQKLRDEAELSTQSSTPESPEPEPTSIAAKCWSPPTGPHVMDDPDRPISFDETQEIEAATGRPYQQGDTIHGRAEDRCPA